MDFLFNKDGPVEEIELDAELELHLRERGGFEKHIVSLAEIREVFDGTPQFWRNSPAPGRRAPLVMVGPTLSGRFLTVPIEPTGKWGIWRPVTAFTSNTYHRERYWQELDDV